MEWWGTLLISIASAIAGGLVTDFFNRRSEKRKQRYQEQQIKKAELKKEYEERPRLEIKVFKDIEHGSICSNSDCKCVLLNIEKIKENNKTFSFFYDEKGLDEKNLCCVEYEFLNTGKTEIDSVCIISTHPRTTSIIELENREELFKNKTICYEAWSKKRHIKPGECVSIMVCYIKEKIMISPISASTAIYLQDINGNLWHQPLFCPSNETDNSSRASYKEFRNNRSIKLALECFKNPSLW